MSAAYPLTRCEIAFTSNPLDTTQNWAEVVDANGTAILKAVKVQRGATGAMHVLRTLNPGTARFTFTGIGRELDPTNTNSPYSPNVAINKQIRFGVVVNALTTAEAAITGGWNAGANTTLSYGSNKLTLTNSASSAQTLSASTPLVKIAGNRDWLGLATVANVTTARTATFTLTWANAAGTTISSTSTASSDSGGVAFSLDPGVLPANAAQAQLTVSIAAAAAGEQHTVTLAAIQDKVIATSWQPGWGSGALLWTGFIDTISPQWRNNVATDIVITASDTSRILQQTQLPADPFVTRAIADGATALWPLDDPVGSTTAREVVGGQSGTTAIRGGLPTFGASPRGASFTPTTVVTTAGAVFVPKAANISGTGAFTVEGWFNTLASTAGELLGNSSVPGQGFILLLTVAGGPPWYSFRVGDGTSTIVVNGGTSNLQDGAWHHAVGVRALGGTYTLYIDGQQIGQLTGQAMLDPSTGNPPPSFWGSTAAGVGIGISACAMYQGVALSAAQVLDHYTRGKQWFTTPEKSGTRLTDVLGLIGFPSSLYAAPGSGSDSGQSNIQAPTTPPGTVNAYLQSVAQAENGRIFARPDGVMILQDRYHQLNVTPTVTFGENSAGGEIPYRPLPDFAIDNLDLYNASTVTMQGGNPQTYTGTTSTQFGATTNLTETNLISAGGDAEALSRAQYNVSRYQTPIMRARAIVVNMLANLGSAASTVLLSQPSQSVEIGQQVNLKRRPYSTAASSSGFGNPIFSQTSTIEGIEHDFAIGPGGTRWDMTLHLSPADTQQYWVLGTSQLGTTTRLAY